jgi:asparagine synthase (glutamine-hydrolysing)
MMASVPCDSDASESITVGPASLSATTTRREAPPAIWRSFGGDDSGVVLVADCRLDDADALRATLGASPDVAEVALLGLGYERWGFDLPQHLFGDFAFALWDSRKRLLFASRDPFGVSPLVYARLPSRFYVASNVEMILGIPSISRDVSESSVVDYLGWDNRYVDRTFFREIFNVPGGHSLIARSDSTRIVRHWYPPAKALRLSGTEEYQEEFRRLFRRAVKARLRGSTVIHVSGGLDSSAIISVAGQLVDDGEVNLWSVRGAAALHPGLACDEQPFIEAVASHVDIPIETWNGTQSLNFDLDDPSIAAPGSRIVLSGGTEGDVEIAKSVGAKALLNGSGGDQLGTPAGVLTDLIAHGKWKQAFRHTFLFPGATLPIGLARARRALTNFVPEPVRRRIRTLRPKPSRPPWLNPNLSGDVSGSDEQLTRSVRHYSFVEKRHWQQLTAGRLPASIDWFQRHSHRHGLESRFPFLDRALATFVMSIPYDHWPPPFSDERFHREALRKVLPPVVATRRTKAEFAPALARRVRAAFASIYDIFWGNEWLASRFVDQSAARSLLAKLQRAPESEDFFEWYGAWSIATLETWLRAIKRYSPGASSRGDADAKRQSLTR